MRTKEEKVRIYTETLNSVVKRYKTNQRKISREMGRGDSWLAHRVSKDYGDFTQIEVIALCSIIGCTQEELKAIPAASKPEEKPAEAQKTEGGYMTRARIVSMQELMVEGFRMLHTDIRNLIETMDKYWKPEPPKYQVKEREQD